MENKNLQDKHLPCDIEMEKYLLGAMLCRGEVIPKVTAILSANDFFRPTHRTIFNAILSLRAENKPANTLTVFLELRKTKKINETDVGYLTALPEFVNSISYIDDYIKIVKDKANQRRAISAAQKIISDFRAENKATPDIIADAVNSLANISHADNQPYIFDTAENAESEFTKFAADMVLYADRKTGFENLDELHNFTPGLYVLGAVPAAGKTTFAWQLAEQLALQGEHCFYFTYEIGRNALWAKSIARQIFLEDPFTFTSTGDILYRSAPDSFQFGVNLRHLRNFIENLKGVGGKLTVVECPPNFTVENIFSTIAPAVFPNKKSPIVFVDYLQKIKSDNDSVKGGIDDIVQKLKYHQRQTNTTFVIISSFNRMNYYQPVVFESFKESGGIEYEADVVWGMQLAVMENVKVNAPLLEVRQAVEEAKRAQPRIIQLKCLKYRDGGNYDCIFDFHSAHSHFQPNYDWRSNDNYRTTTTTYVGGNNPPPEDDDEPNI